MAARVFSHILLITLLFSKKALSNGRKDDDGSQSKTLNCDGFFCPFVLTPCIQYTVTGLNRTGSIDMAFSGNLSNCAWELTPGQAVTWRVHTSSNYSDPNSPLLVTIRQLSNGYTTSWTLPDQSDTFGIESTTVSRTLCPTLPVNESGLSLVVVDLLSRSRVSFSLQISIEPVWNFQLSLDTPLNFTLSGVLSSQAYYFPFPNDSLSLFSISSIDSSGGSQTCLITSIQKSVCPYESTLEKIQFEGEYQTMGNQSTFVVETVKYPSDGLFVVFIPTAYNQCAPGVPEPTSEGDDYSKDITVTIISLEPITAVQHLFSWLLPFILSFILFLLSLSTLTYCMCGWSWDAFENCQPCKRDLEHVKIVKISLASALRKRREDVRVVHMTQSEGLSQKYLTYFWYSVTVGVFYALPALQALLYKLELLSSSGNQDLCFYNFKCAYPAIDGNVRAMNNIYSNMIYVLLGILFIFFVFVRSRLLAQWKKKHKSLPAVVCRLDKIADRLAELDQQLEEHADSCDDAQLEDMELVCKERLSLIREQQVLEGQGLPEFNAVYYAIGFALLMEGVMSGIYHICPTDTNFQFDTAFMFVMGGLLIIKIMQARHPDLHTHSYIVFLALAFILFLTFFGIKMNSFGLAVAIFLLMMLVIPLAVASLYFYHPPLWQGFSLRGCLKGIVTHLRWCCSKKARDGEYNEIVQEGEKAMGMSSKRAASPVCSTDRLIHTTLAVSFALLLNFSVFLYVTISYGGIGMGFVTFLMINLVALSLIYVINKIWYCERWTLIPLIWGVIGGLAWAFALYFFLFARVYITEETPAQSQDSNSGCLPGTFFDYHDLWHMLSAIALYSTASAILSMDDGLVKTPINKIPVF